MSRGRGDAHGLAALSLPWSDGDGAPGLFDWVEDGFGCALAGQLPREQALLLADAVCKQAEDRITPARPAARPPAS